MTIAWYFAYGSNMDAERMRTRGVGFVAIRGGRLPGYGLCFDKRAGTGYGHACFRHAPGEVLEGVLYRLDDPAGIVRLDPYERTPVNYSREPFTVATDSESIVAWTYVANPAVLEAGLRPQPDYLAHLLAGQPWLSPDYHARLARWPTAPRSGAMAAVAAPAPHA